MTWHAEIITLFPEMIQRILETSITGRALESGKYSFNCRDLRPYGEGSYLKTDDRLFGGGTGMLMMPEPIYQAWLDAGGESTRTIYLSPKGKVFDQALAREFAAEDRLIFLCGHYEGVDDRALKAIGAEEVSLGDFVLTGGEIAVAAMIDATVRLLPGVLASEESYEDESHYRGLLESRHFTQPASWRGLEVPEELRSGHHEKIKLWRKLDSLRETLLKRPDLLDSYEWTIEEYELMAQLDYAREGADEGSREAFEC